MLTHSWMQYPWLFWYHLQAKSSPDGQKTQNKRSIGKRRKEVQKVGRKRCLREMVYISRCHRDLFLFLWGFNLVTELSFQDFFSPKSTWVIYHLLWGLLCWQNFLSSQILDSGFRLEVLRGATSWHCWERESRKLRMGEGVIKIISLGTFLKRLISPTPDSWSNHIKEVWGVRPSDPLCVVGKWERLELLACALVYILKPEFR